MSVGDLADGRIARPGPDEHHEYYGTYVAQVADDDVLRELSGQLRAVRAAFDPFGETGSLHRYASDKWSVREMLGHLCDTERLFVYRGLTFARGDTTELPGMDENAWVRGASFDQVPLADLLDEFGHVRRATISLYRTLDADALARRGVANGSPISVRAIPWIIAGHAAHHLRVLHERYR